MRILVLISCFVFTHELRSQNLVPNPSFEDSTYCPNGNTYKAADWFSPTQGTPDVMHGAGTSGSCFESCEWIGWLEGYNCFAGYQVPLTGNAMVGFQTMGSLGNNQREYIACMLTDTLITGKKYCVSFYTSLGDNSGYAHDGIGVCFSSTPFNDCSGYVLIPWSSGVANPLGNVIVDTLNWILVSDTFIASGGERYITIGNFFPDTSCQVVLTGVSSGFSYHFIDDISVVYCDINPPAYPEISLFPNPSSGNFTINGNFPAGSELIIYNMLGQQVSQTIPLPEGNNSVPFVALLAQGTYIGRIEASGTVVKSIKIVVSE